MNVKSIILPTVALVAGLGIGATTLEPEVQTKTKEVEVIKEVEVPGPVETKVETKEVTKEVIPQACKDAIQTAREVAANVAFFAETASEYPPLVGRAFEAGLNQDSGEAQSVISKMEELNDDLGKAADTAGPQADAFNKAAEGCK